MPATLAHLDALARLEGEAMGEEAWSRAQVEAELHASDRVVRIATGSEDRVDAYASLAVAGDTADLLRIAVAPGSRRRGVAAALLADALDALPDSVETVLLEVAEQNTPALALYGRAGFTEIARRQAYYRDGSAAVVMQLRLDSRGGPA